VIPVANLVTQVEIMKYAGVGNAVFPEGTIITPSAIDWARENKIKISMSDSADSSALNGPIGNEIPHISRDEYLYKVIRTVVIEYKKTGLPVVKEDIVKVAIECLKRLGCNVEG
jgi:hypothetical protein